MNDEFADDFKVDENVKETEIKQEVEVIPARTDDRWSDYLMSKLSDKEIYKRDNNIYPKVSGLRRLVLAYLGTIINSGIKSFIPPNLSYNNGKVIQQYATVVYEVSVELFDGKTITYSEIADAHPEFNLDKMVAGHPSPMAATRAEARALRKMLGVTTTAYEEIQGSDKNVVEILNSKNVTNNMEEASNQDSIQRDQITVINSMCRKLNVDMGKLIKTVLNLSEKTFLNDLSREEGQELCSSLADFKKKNNVPAELLKTIN